MKKMAERDWVIRYQFFKQCKYTEQWSESKINLITESSSIQEYSPNTVILKNSLKKTHVHFIISGQCKVVQNIQLYEKRLYKGYKEYYLKKSHSYPDLFKDLGTVNYDESLYYDDAAKETVLQNK